MIKRIRHALFRWRHRKEMRALRAELAEYEARLGPERVRLAAAYLMALGWKMEPPPPMGAWRDAYRAVETATTPPRPEGTTLQ